MKVFAFNLVLILTKYNSLAASDSVVPYNSYLNFLASLTSREARFIRPNEEAVETSERDPVDLSEPNSLTTGDILLEHEPNIRDQEYIEHSSLFGHQFVTGGAGEGIQRLKPDGSIPNIQVIKTDSVLPAYCNPPNPCPPGYTEEDGCIEDFTNTATFSRDYQAQQQCICDTEHMFDCPGSSDDSELDTLARTIQNNGLTEETVERFADAYTRPGSEVDGAVDANGHQRMMYSNDDDSHKIVAKKFFSKRTSSKSSDHSLDGPIDGEPVAFASSFERSKKREVLQGNHQIHHVKNFPWMQGEFTPQVMAKKSPIYAIPF